MGPKLTEFLLEGDRGGRPAVSGVRAILYRGYQTREGRENSASNRRYGHRGRESDAGPNRPRAVPLTSWRLAVSSLQLAVCLFRASGRVFVPVRLDENQCIIRPCSCSSLPYCADG